MTRIPVPPKLLLLSAALMLALCACSRQSESPQEQAAAPPAAAEQSPQTPPAPADTSQQASQPTAATASAQPTDGDSSSLEHLAGLPAAGALPSSSQWKPGVNYDVISPAQPTTVAPGKVEVLEVFWLGCPHCFALEPYIRQWLKTKPSYVQFVRVPVMWDPMHQAHARLYYTLEALGRDDLVEKAFAYLHQMEDQTGTEAVLFSNDKDETLKEQQAWAEQNGIKADAFANAYNSFYVNTQMQQAQEVDDAYQVQSVPFLAVDGKFSTDVGKAGGENQLISLISFLAAWQHDHTITGVN
jgi:protein dithiol oxidoreductase (disulfide-forming)